MASKSQWVDRGMDPALRHRLNHGRLIASGYREAPNCFGNRSQPRRPGAVMGHFSHHKQPLQNQFLMRGLLSSRHVHRTLFGRRYKSSEPPIHHSLTVQYQSSPSTSPQHPDRTTTSLPLPSNRQLILPTLSRNSPVAALLIFLRLSLSSATRPAG